MPTAIRRSLMLATVAALVMTMLAVVAPAADAAHAPERTYRVTVENLTDTQILTPAIVATHKHRVGIFRPGEPASNGIQQLAENGGVPVLAAELAATDGVGDVEVAGAGPIAPGGSAEVLISAPRGVQQVSVAAMLICTNDGFAAAEAWLPGALGQSRMAYGNAYDAGTEINTESYADLVPPCDGAGQSGMSNPALAENGVVHPHAGIEGGADLTAADHGWTDPVVKVTVERVRVYEIEVENLTDGQPMTPFVAATHLGGGGIFRPGRDASPGLQALAENGGVPALVAELEAKRLVGTVTVVGGAPLFPGVGTATEVVVADRFSRLSVAGMLICTNDGFGGVNGLRLPARIGESISVDGSAYDAGTEINTEAYEDLVPPCDGSGQTGMSNPALAENGKVVMHPGIVGGADLDPAVHGWEGPVIRVTVTRTG